MTPAKCASRAERANLKNKPQKVNAASLSAHRSYDMTTYPEQFAATRRGPGAETGFPETPLPVAKVAWVVEILQTTDGTLLQVVHSVKNAFITFVIP